MPETGLLLPDLTVKGFRGLRNLTIPRLGRVTLLAGKNGIGKTTVLEAVKIYASRGRRSELVNVLELSDEIGLALNSEGDAHIATDWSSLFYGRRIRDDTKIVIGRARSPDHIAIGISPLTEPEHKLFPEQADPEEPTLAIRVTYNGQAHIVGLIPQEAWQPRLRRLGQELPPTIECHSLGPGILENIDFVQLWDDIALTPAEEGVKEALSFVTGNSVAGIAIVGDSRMSRRVPARRVARGVLRPLVKFHDNRTRIPLRSLGDGALRFFSAALVLANCKDGFLLIDEAENGVHYSIQRAFWQMVFHFALQNNVQVIGTTHSFDCIKGFYRAANDFSESEGRLVRLEWRDDALAAIDYSEKDLAITTERRIEVR